MTSLGNTCDVGLCAYVDWLTENTYCEHIRPENFYYDGGDVIGSVRAAAADTTRRNLYTRLCLYSDPVI